MGIENWQILAALWAAHFVGDFWLQPDWFYERKRELPFLGLHGLVHALLATLAVGFAGNGWVAPLTVFVTHCLLDLMKLRCGPADVRWFAGDQLGHLLVLALLAWFLPDLGVTPPWPAPVYPVLAVLAGAIAAVWGGSHLVGLAVARWSVESEGGLPDAGRIIGQLERALVFVLVLVGEPGGIGFLVAAKSVFRFGKTADERKVSEYVIIGTLWSFGHAVVVAFTTSALVDALVPVVGAPSGG